MSEKSLLTVIMPVYNGERYLSDAIESVLFSTYHSLELVIVDDGSTDHSSEIYTNYSRKDSRIRIIKQKNSGIANARNAGLRNANGKYIAFIDQDDKVSSDMYKKCIERMENDGSNLCVTNYYKWTKNDNIRNEFVSKNCCCWNTLELCADLVGVNDANKEFHFPDFRVTHCIWNCVYDASVILKYGLKFFRFVDYEDDYLFNVEFLKYCKSVSFDTYYGYFWRQWGKTESNHHKYISNLYEKRTALTDFLESSLEGYSGKLSVFKMVNYRKNLIWSFYNESMFTTLSECRIKMEHICNENKSMLKCKGIFVGAPIKDKIFLWLLKNKLFSFSYILNRKVLHCYYH